MANLKDTRLRIKSVRSTEQLTKAMKMVAASKLRRAQDRAIGARPYTESISDLLFRTAQDSAEGDGNKLLEKRDRIKNILIILVASDRGLCGAFNSAILKFGKHVIDTEYQDYLKKGNLQLYCIGKKSVDFFVNKGYPVAEKFPDVFSRLAYSTAETLSKKVEQCYADEKADKVVIIYNEFKNLLSTSQKKVELLPVVLSHEKKEVLQQPIYEPSPQVILNLLLPAYLSMQIWKALVESNAAEEASRMIAMDSASENAKGVIRTLNVLYNRARQAEITKELIEIVSGANALEQGG